MELLAKSRRYEATPFRLMASGIPAPGLDALPDSPPDIPDEFHWPVKIPIVGLSTRTMTLEESRERGEALLRRCRHRLRQGERWALAELLDDYPGLIIVPWVCEEVLRFQRNGLGLRRRGRPRGRFEKHPLVVVGLVNHLRRRGQARTLEDAFLRIGELGLLSPESARECFHRGMGDERFAPILVEFPEAKRLLSAAEAAELLGKVERLEPGKTIKRQFEDKRFGTVQVVFESR